MNLSTAAQAAIDHANVALNRVDIYLAVPVSGDAEAPAGAGDIANQLWSYGKWVGAVIAAFALLVIGITAWMQHQSGRPNESMGKIGIVFGGIALIAGAPIVIGTLTGT